ncbi:hypothetical protein BKA60DRAFT_546894 [Fusarium oxysporum]|nr:hypothetical protein BKA60DRAFT_546894 [Fusarium oxysporum]
MRSNLITVLACLSLVAAMPAKREPMDERAVKAILDEVEARGKTVDRLDQARCPQADKLRSRSGCLAAQGRKGRCLHQAIMQITAGPSTTLSSQPLNTLDGRTRTCTAHTKTWNNGVDFQLVEAKLEKVIPDTANKVSLGTNIKYQHSDVQGDTKQICTTDGTTNRCTWDDQACHQVWYADRTKRICKTSDTLAVQQQTKNKNGRWIHVQAEFSIALPVNHIVGCNAKCEDLTYDEPLPNKGIERTTFDISFD